MKNSEVQHGFTLLEIVIAMVFIGLLLGSALTGRQVIESVKVKSIFRFHDQFNVAHYVYPDTHLYLLGSTPNVADNFPDYRINLTSFECNGDGSVAGNWQGCDTIASNESALIWAPLEATWLISACKPTFWDCEGAFAFNTIRISETALGDAVAFEYRSESGYLGFPGLFFNGSPKGVALKSTLIAEKVSRTQVRFFDRLWCR